ncbi:TPA: N-6 DNA methylase [Streptococcus pyogenes]|uniref:N-6 DNA methylase n=1 Tax=Streptococcus pyogenes TaxID=1314 RepID=UPI00109D5476|nr:N-6 DNA methylase [Streptococcus pyogenes]VGX12405.1 N-6 DNA methylase [Streptococcus pyogenes]VGX20572.1 N-6 DNA methylase [Streptococcus pyogenes]VHH09585.1 N-6 DNA methylase [Streptococcus pyogenes]HEP1750887.1 N-6 DNA methylase [Streptococcus pyogenes]HEP1960083.1 N-6 DNA methylase [Streptococcus pyogenes]
MSVENSVEEIHNSRQIIKKETQRLNQLLHTLNITAPQRVLYISGMLLSMQPIIDNDEEIIGLTPGDLMGSLKLKTDGEKIVDRISYYLISKNIEKEKRKLMLFSFSEISKDRHRDRKSPLAEEVKGLLEDAASPNKQIFTFIFENIYKVIQQMNKHIDIMGEMYSEFLRYALGDGKEIGIILTPPQVTQLMAKLIGINSDSKVLDLTTGSAGFLISAMEIMCSEAEIRYVNESAKLQKKIKKIKSHQLMGIELNAEMYTLAATNMILRGDGSSTIIKEDAFRLSSGTLQKFGADRLLLNPPFSYFEKGMSFVKLGLDNLKKRGLAAVIIQDSAGSGQALQTNKEILKAHTLLASIKMPKDLFLPMAGVQTSIYIFKAGEPHNFKNKVRFVDFRDDGYLRTNRAIKAVSNPEIKYATLIDTYLGKVDSSSYCDKYIEDTISSNGNDWNFEHHYHTNYNLEEKDFSNTINEHYSWKIRNLLEKRLQKHQNNLGKQLSTYNSRFLEDGGKWSKYKIGDLFEKVEGIKKPRYSVRELKDQIFSEEVDLIPALTATSSHHGLAYKVPSDSGITTLKNVISVSSNGTNSGVMFYQPDNFTILQDSYAIKFKNKELSKNEFLYFLTAMQKEVRKKYDWSNKAGWDKIKNETILVPEIKGMIAYDYMNGYMDLLTPRDIYSFEYKS